MDVRWCCCSVGRSGEGDRGMTCVYCAGPHALSECPMWRAVWMPPAVDRATVAVPKDDMIQHGAYMAAVRSLPCDLCRTWAGSQFCHSDILGNGGKGMGIKSDCRLGWPGCPACHYYVGTSGAMPKETRHRYEAAAGCRTRAEIRRRGIWPASLPAWPQDEVAA